MNVAKYFFPALLLALTGCGVKGGSNGPSLPPLPNTVTPATPESVDSASSIPHKTQLPEAEKMREATLEQIIKASTLPEKLLKAKAYFSIFDFQVANYLEVTDDSLSKLQNDLAHAAVLELTNALSEVKLGQTYGRITALHVDNKHHTLMAMAAMLNEISPLQMNGVLAKKVSLFDIISDGLLRKKLVAQRKWPRAQLTASDRAVGDKDKIFEHLLKLRLRTLPLLAVAQVYGDDEELFKKFSEWFPVWVPKFEAMSVVQIESAAQLLEDAILTRNVLRTLETEDDELDRKVANALRSMKAKKVLLTLDSVRDANRIKALERFDHLSDLLLKK